MSINPVGLIRSVQSKSAGIVLSSVEVARHTAERISYRRIRHQEDLEAIGRLRCRAYDRTSVYKEKFGDSVIEEIDLLPETYLFGVYEGSSLVASVRINKLSADSYPTPAMSIFGAFLSPLLEQGMTFVDPSRLVVDPEAAGSLPGLALLTMRLGPVSTHCLHADYLLGAVAKEHTPFYRRLLGMSQLAGPIKMPHMNVQAYLLAAARTSWDDLVLRYPVFQYTATERRLLFDDADNGLPYLSARPTIAFDKIAG